MISTERKLRNKFFNVAWKKKRKITKTINIEVANKLFAKGKLSILAKVLAYD